MTGKLLVILASATLAACSIDSHAPDQPTPTTPTSPKQVTLPSVTGGPASQLYTGQITLTSDSGPGTATFTSAPSFDLNGGPTTPSFGGGSFSLQFSSSSYAQPAAQSAFVQQTDPQSGTNYLVLVLFAQPDASTGQSLNVIVPVSDFQPGATLALDGQTRFAAFGAGPIDQPQPTFFAVALSGTVSFGASSSLTGTVDATLSATFSVAQLPADPTAPDPTRSPDGGTTTPAPLAAGTYTLAASGPTTAQCYGSLAGDVNDFNALVASAWFSSTSLIVGGSSAVPTASAPGFASLFGEADLALSPLDGGPWGYTGAAPTPSAGPDGTTLAETAFWLDAGGSSGLALLFQPSADDGTDYCSVEFLSQATPSP